tara:strand:+ start:145 stop:300 length:156 start_codon:yes stop_codon:yes gene_type:complete
LVQEGNFPQKLKISLRRIVFMRNDIEDWIKTEKIITIFKTIKGHVFASFES